MKRVNRASATKPVTHQFSSGISTGLKRLHHLTTAIVNSAACSNPYLKILSMPTKSGAVVEKANMAGTKLMSIDQAKYVKPHHIQSVTSGVSTNGVTNPTGYTTPKLLTTRKAVEHCADIVAAATFRSHRGSTAGRQRLTIGVQIHIPYSAV